MPGPTDEELKEFRHQRVFYTCIFSRRRPNRYNDEIKYSDERWVPFHVAQAHYETVEDFMKGVRQARRNEFKFTFHEEAKRVTITLVARSCLALNPWMVDMSESDTFVGFTITLRHVAACKKVYERFWLLESDEYDDVVTEQITDERIRDYPSNTDVIRARSDKVISWRASHLAFQTIYIQMWWRLKWWGTSGPICCASSHPKEAMERWSVRILSISCTTMRASNPLTPSKSPF